MPRGEFPLYVIAVIITLLFLLLGWSWWQMQHSTEMRDDLLIGLLLLGIVAFGVFLTYALIDVR